MWLLLACSPPEPALTACPPPAAGPTARERLGPGPWGVGRRGCRSPEVVALEGGRWATRSRGRWEGWVLWDPALGRRQAVADPYERVPTPDGAWLYGGAHPGEHWEEDEVPILPLRLDPGEVPCSRLELRPGGRALAWSEEAVGLLPAPHATGPGASPDGVLDLVASEEGLALITTPDAAPIALLPECQDPAQVWWSADGTRLVCRSPAGFAAYRRDGHHLGAWEGKLGKIRPALSADGRLVAFSTGRAVQGWQVDEDRDWSVPFAQCVAAAPTDDGSLVIVSDGIDVALLDPDGSELAHGRPASAVLGPPDTVRADRSAGPPAPPAERPDPVSVSDRSWRIGDPWLSTDRVRWEGEVLVASGYSALRIEPDGEARVVSADLASEPRSPPADRHGLPAGAVWAEDPDGNVVATADDANLWVRRTDGETVQLSVPRVRALAASRERLAFLSPTVGLALVDLATGELSRTLAGPALAQFERSSMSWSPDGSRLALANGETWVWSEDGALVRDPGDGRVVALASSASGRTIAAHTHHGTVIGIDVVDGVRWRAGPFGSPKALGFVGDEIIAEDALGDRTVLDADGRVLGSTSGPGGLGAGLRVDDEGEVVLVTGGRRWRVDERGAYTLDGLDTTGTGWRLALGDNALIRHPGLVDTADDDGPMCAEGCPDLARPPPVPGRRGGREGLLPSPDGRWAIRIARGEPLAMYGPGGQISLGPSVEWIGPDGPIAAWASPGLAVLALPRAIGAWPAGGRPAMAAATGLTFALSVGGRRQARLGPLLLVGPIGEDRVECVLPGGERGDRVALSPSGQFAAWTQKGALWRADVSQCRVLQRPPERTDLALAPPDLLARSPSGRCAVTRPRPTETHLQCDDRPPVPIEAVDPRDLAVTDEGLVAWLEAGDLVWQTPDRRVHRRPTPTGEPGGTLGAGTIEAIASHPSGALMIAAQGTVHLLRLDRSDTSGR